MRARLPDWRERLCDFIAARQAIGFDWPAHNCALLWADAIAAMTGADPVPEIRGYPDARGALRSLRRAGFESVADLCAAKFEAIARPQFGDGVLLPEPPLDLVMIADGRGCAWAQDETGLVRIPLPPGVSFWRA